MATENVPVLSTPPIASDAHGPGELGRSMGMAKSRTWIAMRRLRQALEVLGPSDVRSSRLARLERLFGWRAPAATGVVTLAVVAGAVFRAQPVALGASIVALSATLLLLLWSFGTRLLGGLDDANLEREHLRAALVAQQEKAAELQSLAYTDNLTGLPNRSLFYDRLGLAIRHSTRDKSRLAVLFFDLDGFKALNDSFGHSFGDRVLAELAERIRDSVRGEDTVSRFGGDEFIVLLPQVTGAADAARVARKVLDALRLPFRLDGREVAIDASVGVAVLPDDGTSAEELVRKADSEMYRAKGRQA
jgi:diguanylate cyclase (GGDEF)-like protein